MLSSSFSKFLATLSSHGWKHWLAVAALITVGLSIGDSMEHSDLTLRWQYRLYQLLNHRARGASHSDDVSIVRIGDDEYWKGDLARRSPLKRTYLANLLQHLQKANPTVIALDIDMRAQTNDGTLLEHEDYRVETATLLTAISSLPDHCILVLAKAIQFDARSLTYASLPDTFDSLNSSRIARGYIFVADDVRRVALSVPGKRGPIESFASAIVGRCSPHAVADARDARETALPFGRFHSTDFFDTVTSDDVIHEKPEAMSKLHRIVIVGGGWSRWAYGAGPPVDGHVTPIGTVPGVYVHANYVHALLAHETTAPMNEKLALGIDIALSVAAALLFAGEPRTRRWWALVGLNFVAIMAFLVLWQNFGIYFDFFIPLLLLSGHVVIDVIREWRSDALKYRQATDVTNLATGEISP
jgi:CHASE2 domain-containing sensor protein